MAKEHDVPPGQARPGDYGSRAFLRAFIASRRGFPKLAVRFRCCLSEYQCRASYNALGTRPCTKTARTLVLSRNASDAPRLPSASPLRSATNAVSFNEVHAEPSRPQRTRRLSTNQRRNRVKSAPPRNEPSPPLSAPQRTFAVPQRTAPNLRVPQCTATNLRRVSTHSAEPSPSLSAPNPKPPPSPP